MIKHTMLVFLLFAMTTIPPIGCDCPDLALEDFTVGVFAYPPTDTTFTETDSVYISLDFNWEHTAQVINEPIFNNSLYALSCGNELGIGLTDIRITSDNEFNNIPPGNNLADIFYCNIAGGPYIDDCIRIHFKTGIGDVYYGISFLFTQVPTTFKEHVFTVRLTDDNNEYFYASTDTVRWQ